MCFALSKRKKLLSLYMNMICNLSNSLLPYFISSSNFLIIIYAKHVKGFGLLKMP